MMTLVCGFPRGSRAQRPATTHAGATPPAAAPDSAPPPWVRPPGEEYEHDILPVPLDTTRDANITPDSLLLTDRAPTATLTFYNPSDESDEIFFGPECEGKEYDYLNSYDNLMLAQLHRLPIDPITAAWRNGGSCAAAWLVYPRSFHVGPRERRTITLRVVPPATLPNGRYTARVISGKWSNGLAHDAVDITYIRTTSPWRALRWRPTPAAGPGSARVTATPTMLAFHDTSAISFTLINHAAIPVPVWLYVDCPWFMVDYTSYGPFLSQYEMTWHAYIPNLSLMLVGMPQYVVLAPHERRTIPVALNIGTNGYAMGGDHTVMPHAVARIVYTEAPVELGDQTFTTPQGAVNVVNVPRSGTDLKLARPTVYRLDTTWLACDTLKNAAALGFVATLHAEVHDTQGRPAPILAPPANAPATRWRVGTPWTFDSTVAVWNVYHSTRSLRVDPEVKHKDGEPRSPLPACFFLPRFAPGHYELVLQGYEFQDVERRSPVRVAVPLDIP